MRTRLLPGLTAALARNSARQQSRVRLFELGRTFAAGSDAPIETRRIAAVACGDAASEQWGVAARKLDLHDIKGDLDSLAALSGAALEYRASTQPFAHPGRSADVYRLNEAGEGVCIGWIGQLHPRVQQAMAIDAEVYGFEIALDALLARPLSRAAALSRYPSVRRDLAFIVPESVPWAVMQASVRQAAGNQLRDLQLFDRYVGKGVESGCKSLAMALILQDDSRTLTDRDVDAVVAEVVATLSANHGAVIRG
jgi:phenylalanyl-tRNA synthetase beta chain